MKNVWWFSKIKEGEAPTEKRTERKREQTQGAPFGEFHFSKLKQQWEYLVLGRAYCQLGLMEDTMVLLQTGKRLATAAFRRESSPRVSPSCSAISNSQPRILMTESESITQLLSHIKLIRRRTVALAALDAGLYSEAIHHASMHMKAFRRKLETLLSDARARAARILEVLEKTIKERVIAEAVEVWTYARSFVICVHGIRD